MNSLSQFSLGEKGDTSSQHLSTIAITCIGGNQLLT